MSELVAEIERPSGKGGGDENFPVGSRLIAPHLRPHVMTYYRFARGADDIADSPDLDAGEKHRRLDALAAGFAPGAPGPALATRLRDSLAATGVEASCALDLLRAFHQDADNPRTADWDALRTYCAWSAHPVGRYLMQLHGEDPGLAPLSDALCAALQVLNHLQDIQADWRALGRVYLPADWLAAAGVRDDDLGAAAASPGLRAVIDRMLAATAPLLAQSRPLAGRMRDRRLAAETAAIHALACRLARRLARQDPLAGRVRLTRLDFARAGLAALIRLGGGGRA